MRVADFQHYVENRVPSLRLLQLRIWEHAPVPADVLDAAFGRIFEPVAGAFHDVELEMRVKLEMRVRRQFLTDDFTNGSELTGRITPMQSA